MISSTLVRNIEIMGDAHRQPVIISFDTRPNRDSALREIGDLQSHGLRPLSETLLSGEPMGSQIEEIYRRFGPRGKDTIGMIAEDHPIGPA